MNISLSDHFSYKKLILFSLPSILIMLVTSSYQVVDGYFISNYVGKVPFAAVNLIYPVLLFFLSFSLMFGAGGAALVSYVEGEGKRKLANEYFSIIIRALFILAVFCCVPLYIFLPQVAELAGAKQELIDLCVEYGRILVICTPCYMLGEAFVSFLFAAEKPEISFYIAVFTAIFNTFLDYLFITQFEWGLTGAALATGFSWTTSCLVPLVYFCSENSSRLRLVSCKMDIRPVLKACSNGVADVIEVFSVAVITLLIDYRLIQYFGENGVVVFGVVSYISRAAYAVSAGYGLAITSVVGYHCGAKNYTELKSILRKSTIMLLIFGCVVMLIVHTFAGFFAGIFVEYDEHVRLISQKALENFSLAFCVVGFNVFGPCFFSGMNNGKVSAIVSTFQNLIFPGIAIFVLPFFFGKNSFWFFFFVAELGACFVLLLCYYKNRESFCGPKA